MEIAERGATVHGSAEMFVGAVYLDVVAHGEVPSRVRVNRVQFAPGARTAWHCHGLGQTLFVLEGIGLVGTRQGQTIEIHPGDRVVTPPQEWHFHGATPNNLMTHLSITEAVIEGDLPESSWAEHLDEADYLARADSALSLRSA